MTNVLKLDQIWQFQNKDGKNTKFLVHIFSLFFPQSLGPLIPPPQKKFDAGPAIF